MKQTLSVILISFFSLISSAYSAEVVKNPSLDGVPSYSFGHNNVVRICKDISTFQYQNIIPEKLEKAVLRSTCLSEIKHYGFFRNKLLLVHKNDLKNLCKIISDKYLEIAESKEDGYLIESSCHNSIIPNYHIKIKNSFIRPDFSL